MRIKKIMLFISAGLILLVAAIFLLLYLQSPGKPKPFLDENGAVLKNSISEKILIDINGSKQGMFIKGENVNNPIILYLHGGMPDYFLTEKYPTYLEKNFTVIWWEQRGCGISYNSELSNSYTSLDQLTDDIFTLTEYLKTRFNKQKIYLMGHSGGTFIGIHAIDKKPDLFHAYIGIAQISNQRKSEYLAYNYLLNKYKEQGNQKMVEDLKNMSFKENDELPITYLNIRDKSMHELGIGTMRNMKNLFTDLFLPSLLFSEYSIKDKFNLWKSKSQSGISQNWNSMTKENLIETKNAFKVPVYFFHGKYDYTCSYDLAKEYFLKIKAPVKGFYTFENSAHSPLFEEPEKMNSILVKDVLNYQTNLADSL